MTAELPEASDQTVYCTSCSRPLGIFPEDQPDWATGPICGECYQSLNWEDQVAHDQLYEEDETPW